MLILFAATLIANPSVPAHCRPADKTSAPTRAGLRKLGELPPGQQIKAVWRFDENGCPKPVVVRAKVGTGDR